MSDPTEVAVNKYLLSLGSNINPDENIIRAGVLLATEIRILRVSSIWKTAAIGSDGPDFLNAAVLAKSVFAPADLKTKLLIQIENKLGRTRTNDKNSPRTIDIDILMINENIIDQEIWSQAHICVPASEIYPNLSHPETGILLKDQANILTTGAKISPAADLDLKFLVLNNN